MARTDPGAGGAPGQGADRDWDGARYDAVAAPQARWGEAVVRRLALDGDETVLDAGCGSGRVTEALLARLPAGRVVAVDASASMLEAARRRLGTTRVPVRFVRADLLALSPAHLGGTAPVDAVLSTATFHWVIDHEQLFANLARVLRSGGQLVAQCGGEGNVARLVDVARSLGVARAGTWHYASVDQTVARLEAAGFVDVRVWAHPEPTAFEPGAPFIDFLEAVCLREHLATLAPEARRPFTERVAEAMGAPTIDYVRLNMVARRGP